MRNLLLKLEHIACKTYLLVEYINTKGELTLLLINVNTIKKNVLTACLVENTYKIVKSIKRHDAKCEYRNKYTIVYN